MFFLQKQITLHEVYQLMNQQFQQLEKDGRLREVTMNAINNANRVSSLYMQEFDEKKWHLGNRNLDTPYQG